MQPFIHDKSVGRVTITYEATGGESKNAVLNSAYFVLLQKLSPTGMDVQFNIHVHLFRFYLRNKHNLRLRP